MNLHFGNLSEDQYTDVLKIYADYYLDPKKMPDKNYVRKMENTGFVVGEPLLYKELANSPFFEVAYVDSKVVGFIRADKATNNLYSEEFKLDWLGTGDEWKNFISENGLELGLILIHPDFTSKGIARELLLHLVNYMKLNGYSNLYSWVVAKPPNRKSMDFHIKNSFKKIALYHAKNLWGIDDYQSTLYLKSI